MMEVLHLAEMTNKKTFPQDLSNAPSGCASKELADHRSEVRASLRSVDAFSWLFIVLFWNGIVSVFAYNGYGSLYVHYFGPLPASFPPLIEAFAIKDSVHLVAAWFMCSVLMLFFVIGMMICWYFLLSVVGRVDVVLSDTEGCIRTGIGPFRRTRRFDISKVKNVREESTAYVVLGRSLKYIRIDGDQNIRFGLMLATERREWMYHVLHRLLRANKAVGKQRLA